MVNVHVVCNDEETAERDLLPHVYNDRDLIDVEVSYDQLVRTWKLRRILESDVDFLHFVGEVTSEGLVCTDGVVEPRWVHDLGVRAFFLHTCGNYSDAEWLIHRGAYGGVVSTTEIRDGDDALTMGRWMSRLLNQGFTLRSAAGIVEDVFPETMEYTIIGDGGISLIQSRSHRPCLVKARTLPNSQKKTTIELYPGGSQDLGSYWWPFLEGKDANYLTPRSIPSSIIPREKFENYLSKQSMPVNLDGEYLWSDWAGSSKNV